MNALALADSQEQAAARPAVREAVRVTVLRDFEAIRAEWRALNDVAQAGTMFSGPEWLIPWWNHFGQGRELQLLAVREGGQLVGLLPLFAEQARYGGVEVRRLAFLGDGATGCDHLDALALPGREAEVLSAVLAELLNLEWDLLDLDGIRRDSPTVIHLAEAWPAHRVTNHCVRDGKLRFVCPHLPLKGTYEELLEGMGRRENLRRREKWLSRQPGVSIDLAQTPADAPAAMERFFPLHDARWAAAGGSDGLADERYKPFHREVAGTLAESGKFKLYTLYAARRPVACVYGVQHGSTFNYYQSGYQPLWAGKSVGLVLLARTVQDAFAAGLTDFDFLRGNESYKAQWAKAERWTVQLRLWRGARGRAARLAEMGTKGAREAAKAAVPGKLLEGARVLRRGLGRGLSMRQLAMALSDGGSAQCEEGGR